MRTTAILLGALLAVAGRAAAADAVERDDAAADSVYETHVPMHPTPFRVSLSAGTTTIADGGESGFAFGGGLELGRGELNAALRLESHLFRGGNYETTALVGAQLELPFHRRVWPYGFAGLGLSMGSNGTSDVPPIATEIALGVRWLSASDRAFFVEAASTSVPDATLYTLRLGILVP